MASSSVAFQYQAKLPSITEESIPFDLGKEYQDWSKVDHAFSFSYFQKIASAWKSLNLYEQYLVLGFQEAGKNFKLEIIPFKNASSIISNDAVIRCGNGTW